MFIRICFLAVAANLILVTATRTAESESGSSGSVGPLPVITVLNKSCNMSIGIDPSYQYASLTCRATHTATPFYGERTYDLTSPQDDGVFTERVRDALTKARARFPRGFLRVYAYINGDPERNMYSGTYAVIALSDDLIRPLGKVGVKDFFVTFTVDSSLVKLSGSLVSTKKPSDVGVMFVNRVTLI